MEMTELQRRELGEGLWRDLEQVVRDEARSEVPLVPRRFEVSFGSERSAPELQRGLDLGRRARRSPGRSTGSTSTRSARAGSSRTTRPASAPTRRARSSASCGCRSRSTCSSCATSSGSSRSAASTARSPATARRAGCCAATRARTRCRASPRNDYLDDEAFWDQVEGAKETALAARRPDPRRRRQARPQGRRVPDLVRPLADVPGEEGVMAVSRPESRAGGRDRGRAGTSSSRPAPGPGRRA